MITLAIFGASGQTGQELVIQALHAGYEVNVLVRKKASYQLEHKNLRVVEGEITTENCQKVVQNSDTVICAIGQRSNDMKPFCASATKAIVEAMSIEGIQRCICLTGAMVGERNAAFRSWFIREMVRMFRQRMPEIADDRRKQEEIIAASGLDWTLVKPPRLSNSSRKKTVYSSENLTVTAFSSISRKDLAAYMLSIIDDSTTFGKFLVVHS
jgi:putative NADH-flavin reductase